ncbi:MAG: DNA recombination protein RmuC [bacterium]|nr:DNA recombination protein RmuC [bacterium]
MTNLLILALVFVILLGFILLFYVLSQKIDRLKNEDVASLLKADMLSVNQTIIQTQAQMNQRLDKAAQVFGGLQNELGRMQELGRSIKDIQDVLKSPKNRGNIGEALMNDLIKQQIPKNNYELQHAFHSGEKVDAVIKTKNGLIPIDSKFPAENYLKYIQTEDKDKKAGYHKEFISDVKKHIQVIAKKYINTSEGTVDFAIMYIPGEAIYYEIMTNTNQSEYGASLRVYLVSPHSFYYFLQTVLLSLEGDLIEEKAKEVMNYLKAIQTDARKFGEELTLVNKHLNNAKNTMDTATASYSRLGSKIESASKLTHAKKIKQIKSGEKK